MDLHLDLGEARGRSKRDRLEVALRDGIRSGRLAPGTRLPASRELCRELKVSRGVVVDAYAQLAAEGYLQTRRGGGTTVARLGPVAGREAPHPEAATRIRHDLDPATPAVAEFPRAAWSAAIGRVLRTVPDDRLGLPDPAGTPELRGALASYLARARGVEALSAQIVITTGTRHSMAILWTALAQLGATAVAVEQPGWRGIYETAVGAGLRVRELAVDDQGIRTDALTGMADVSAVAVAPAHQYPTGAVLSPTRRQELLAWARAGTRLIVEDDYDAEYRYDRHPIGCLQGLAPLDVAYAGTTSKTLTPALRLGWLVVPQRLAATVTETARMLGGQASPILQLALAETIERGELDRHLRRQRRRYQERRAALLEALAARLPYQRVRGISAGLFVVLELPESLDGERVSAEAAARGIVLGVRGTAPDALLIGYANLAATSADRVVREIKQIIDVCGRA